MRKNPYDYGDPAKRDRVARKLSGRWAIERWYGGTYGNFKTKKAAEAHLAAEGREAKRNGTKGAYPFAEKEEQYRRYTAAQLRFAANDAKQAMEAMRGHDPAAENWYADDMATILNEINRRGRARRNPHEPYRSAVISMPTAAQLGGGMARRNGQIDLYAPHPDFRPDYPVLTYPTPFRQAEVKVEEDDEGIWLSVTPIRHPLEYFGRNDGDRAFPGSPYVGNSPVKVMREAIRDIYWATDGELRHNLTVVSRYAGFDPEKIKQQIYAEAVRAGWFRTPAQARAVVEKRAPLHPPGTRVGQSVGPSLAHDTGVKKGTVLSARFDPHWNRAIYEVRWDRRPQQPDLVWGGDIQALPKGQRKRIVTNPPRARKSKKNPEPGLAARGNPRSFLARYPGTCSICQEPIEIEQEIVDTGRRGPRGGKRMAHVGCIGQAPASPKPRQPRPREVDPDPYVVRFVGFGPRGGPWVVGTRFANYGHPTEEAAQKEARRRRAKAEAHGTAVARVASGSPRFGIPIPFRASAADRARYAEPLSPTIERVQGGTYSAVEILRLLDRANSDALPLVERMLDRMLERQTQTERKHGTAIELNFEGFNKPDSYTAEKLKKEAAALRGGLRALAAVGDPNLSIGVHYRMSSLLAKYAQTQLPNMMNAGAQKYGLAMRTNPRQTDVALYQDILAHLRALQWVYWSKHWSSTGPNFYSDHLLLQRLYEGKGGGPDINAAIDGLGERMVAYFGPRSVNPAVIEERVEVLVRPYKDGAPTFQGLLFLEGSLGDAIKRAWQSNQDHKDTFSLGIDDFLMALSDERDTAVYLLRQRSGAAPVHPNPVPRGSLKRGRRHPRKKKALKKAVSAQRRRSGKREIEGQMGTRVEREEDRAAREAEAAYRYVNWAKTPFYDPHRGQERLPPSWEHEWASVFGEPQAHTAGASPGPFKRRDVIKVIKAVRVDWDPGEAYTDTSFYVLVRLEDGRWGYVQAWNDTTGWGCQDANSFAVARSLEELVPQMTDAGRHYLGLESALQRLSAALTERG